MNVAVVAALVLASAMQVGPLAGAEQALVAGDFEAALRLAEVALESPLEPAEATRALEVSATVHAAFSRRDEAVLSFRRLLGISPTYRPGPQTSPKLVALFTEAAALGPIRLGPPASAPPSAQAAPPLAVTPPEPARSEVRATPLHQRWWFWGLVAGGVGVAVGTGLAIGSANAPPSGSLGSVTLR